MNATKPFYKSKTIQGIILMLLPALKAFFDIEIPVEIVEQFFAEFATLVGTALAIYGRAVAKTDLTVLPETDLSELQQYGQ